MNEGKINKHKLVSSTASPTDELLCSNQYANFHIEEAKDENFL